MTASLLVLSTAAMAQPNAATINSGAAALQPKLVEWRRHLHQHPELGNREVQTATYIAAHLKALGIEVREKVGVTGVVGILRGGKPGPVSPTRITQSVSSSTAATSIVPGSPVASRACRAFRIRFDNTR